MTYPGPSTRRRPLPGHTERDMLELEARRGIHVGILPSANHEQLDGVTGMVHTVEQDMRGWTAQQPWSHLDVPVVHICILCATMVEPDFLRDHRCKVAAELAVER